MHDTFLTLLRDRAHWEFELFLMILFDGIVAGILWPFVRLHWRHHVSRDQRDEQARMTAMVPPCPTMKEPEWKRKAGEVTDDGVNTRTCAGPVSPRFDVNSQKPKLIIARCSHPRCTGHLIRTGGQTQVYEYAPPAEAEKPAKTMDTPIGGGW